MKDSIGMLPTFRHRFSLRLEVAWKRGLRAIFRANLINMASSSKQKNSSYKCCAAFLCNNRSDNRPDLIFHNFPLDESLKKIRDQKIKRGDKKCASNSSLFCCSEHFSEKDYRKSLTGKRRDLVKNAVPSILPWSVGNDEASQRSEGAKSREC